MKVFREVVCSGDDGVRGWRGVVSLEIRADAWQSTLANSITQSLAVGLTYDLLSRSNSPFNHSLSVVTVVHLRGSVAP